MGSVKKVGHPVVLRSRCADLAKSLRSIGPLLAGENESMLEVSGAQADFPEGATLARGPVSRSGSGCRSTVRWLPTNVDSYSQSPPACIPLPAAALLFASNRTFRPMTVKSPLSITFEPGMFLATFSPLLISAQFDNLAKSDNLIL